MKPSFRPYFASFRSGWRETANNGGDLVSLVFIYGVLLAFFRAIYSIFPVQELEVPGLTRAHLLWYAAVTESLICGQNLYVFGQMISEGRLIEMMRRPVSMAGLFLSRKMGSHVLTTALQFGLACIVLPGFFDMDFPLPLRFVPFLLLSMLLGIILFEMLGYMISMIEIRGPYSQPLSWIFSKLIFTFGGLFFPVIYFPLHLRQIVRLTPFPAMLSAPAELMLGADLYDISINLGIQIFWVSVMLFFLIKAETYLVRHIQQAGD